MSEKKRGRPFATGKGRHHSFYLSKERLDFLSRIGPTVSIALMALIDLSKKSFDAETLNSMPRERTSNRNRVVYRTQEQVTWCERCQRVGKPSCSKCKIPEGEQHAGDGANS